MRGVSASRICVSLPVHEEPVVVLDQVENLRAFLPADALVVLHLSRALGVEPAGVAPLLPEGVHVNPVSQETAWGDILHLHNANLRFALDQLGPFDHVLLHASNDLYVRPGAGGRIASAQVGSYGVPVAPDMAWAQARPAHEDAMLRAILDDAGATEIFGSSVEGTFYAADLFAEMLERVERHFRHGAGEPYAREEIYYPTLAAHLGDGPAVSPLVYSDVSEERPDVTPGLVWGLVDGTFATAPPAAPAAAHRTIDFDHVYAVKRVARQMHDPARTAVRALGRAQARRMRLEPPFEARGFVALTFVVDVLADPAVLAAWHEAFGSADDATLAILVEEDDAGRVDDLITTAQQADSEAADPADVTLVSLPPGGFEEATLRWSIDALLRSEASDTPPFLDETPLFTPASAPALPHLAARRRRGWLTRTAAPRGR